MTFICVRRGNMVNYVDRVCCCIRSDPAYRYWRRIDNENAHSCLAKVWGRIAASFLALLGPRRSRDRLSVSAGNRTHEEKFRTCGFESLVYLGNLSNFNAPKWIYALRAQSKIKRVFFTIFTCAIIL